MPLILHIDTAVEYASICLSNNSNVLGFLESTEQGKTSNFLQVSIKKILEQTNTSIGKLDAIAVSNGPGSYTGLRVSLSSAKGLCYALNIPLITLNTLQVMCKAAIEQQLQNKDFASALLCPMIDARRMEVYTALYNNTLQEIEKPQAAILTGNSFITYLLDNKIFCFGNGSNKFNNLLINNNLHFLSVHHTAKNMVSLALQKFAENDFADVAYSEPFYLKEFFNATKKD